MAVWGELCVLLPVPSRVLLFSARVPSNYAASGAERSEAKVALCLTSSVQCCQSYSFQRPSRKIMPLTDIRVDDCSSLPLKEQGILPVHLIFFSQLPAHFIFLPLKAKYDVVIDYVGQVLLASAIARMYSLCH